MFCDTTLLVVQNNEVRYFFVRFVAGQSNQTFWGMVL